MAAGSGDGYSADLWDLYEIGRTDIMALAEDYNALATGIAGTWDQSIDPPPAAAGSGVVARGASALRSGAALSALREELQVIFAQSCVNVGAAATSLMDTAAAYAEADEAISEDFASQIASEFDGSEPAAPPQPPFPSGRTQAER